MSAKYQPQPILTTDEPAIYEDFTGGINTDPSNEHLMPNELRDCVNMTYLSGALVKRKGAKEKAKLICKDNLFNIQGIFLFTYRITYIIIAADGKLYYGIYNENTNIFLERLKIIVPIDYSKTYYNPEYLFKGFKERYTNIATDRHEGFIHSYEIIEGKNEDYNFIGDYNKLTDTEILFNDVVNYFGSKYKYISQIPMTKKIINPLTSSSQTYNKYWESVSEGSIFDKTKVKPWSDDLDIKWNTNDIVIYRGSYYKCLISHNTFFNGPSDINRWKKIQEERELIFQNYRKIEAATFNNKLYIATGTRFISISLRNNRLIAEPVTPYKVNNTEIINIGYNYLSPYPEYCRASQLNTVTTSIGGLLVIKTKGNKFILEPQMNFQIGESPKDYLYRWEKKVDNKWYVIHTFKSQDPAYINKEQSSSEALILNTLEVTDADKYQYRVTFANSFDKEDSFISNWDKEIEYNKGDYVSVGPDIYECLIKHTPTSLIKNEDGTSTQIYKGLNSNGNIIEWDNLLGDFNEKGTVVIVNTETKQETREERTFWKIIHKQEAIYYLDLKNNSVHKSYDYAIDKVTGSYFGQAASILAQDLEINDTFNIIQTCTKIHTDGNKLLLYGDRYNSGQWFKTIVNNPSYITDRGCLNFKTTKNEEVIKVVAFQGNIIVFANSNRVGGSIHLVQGNGDDYDSKDGYYSPYRRRTINASISCDNADTIQICDNLLVFKYFNRIYYINASDLNNEVIQVTPCNDRLLHNSDSVIIPWNDNNCISEVTDSYYGLIWKEKYQSDKDGNLILIHPGIRLKMYYKMRNQMPDRSLIMPWLKDESKYLNVEHCIYINGKPIFLYDNLLISFDDNYYQDLNENYSIKINFRGVDCNYPKLYKLLSNVIVYYHRNQYSKLSLNLESKNEAGHLLIDTKNATKSLQNLKALKADDPEDEPELRLDTTILDTSVINSTYKFPFLLIDSSIEGYTKGEFSLSSITYNYTTLDNLNSNPYDLYSSIIRKKDLGLSKDYKGGK